MEEQRILEEERKRQEMEQKRLLVLESQADQWAKAGRIRAYVKAVEHEVSDRVELEPFRDQLREWASWAKQHADNIDPVKKLKMVRQGHPNEGDPLSEDCEM